MRPIIALAMGDPAGISPELTARLLTLDDVVTKARIVVIGDRRVLDDGARVAGVTLDLISASPDADLSKEQRVPVFIDLGHLDPASVARSTATAEGGRFALANYRQALTMARDGLADAVCFTPFNKNAMRLAHPVYDDEISFSADVVGLKGPASEFNVLDGLWNARVTSHIPLAEVAAHITRERVLRARCGSRMPRCERPDSSVRASPSPASTPMPAMAEISDGKRSTRLDPRWQKPLLTGSRRKARFPQIPCSCAQKAARSTPW
jgi:4-hydroxythreonine-4-phosphate dehydrogenase